MTISENRPRHTWRRQNLEVVNSVMRTQMVLKVLVYSPFDYLTQMTGYELLWTLCHWKQMQNNKLSLALSNIWTRHMDMVWRWTIYMWNFWWTHWQWNRIFSEYFIFFPASIITPLLHSYISALYHNAALS